MGEEEEEVVVGEGEMDGEIVEEDEEDEDEVEEVTVVVEKGEEGEVWWRRR